MESVSLKDLSNDVNSMEQPALNIFQKMLSIQNELKTVAKNLDIPTSKTKSYKAVSEVDIINAIKPLEEKYGIYSYPISRDVIDSQQLLQKTDYGEKVSFFLRIKTIYRFVNIDSPNEFIDTTTFADGIDPGDKATGKAMTYADKYALMKAYKISTGEDPDQDVSEEYTNPSNKPSQKSEPSQNSKQDEHGKLLVEWQSCRTKLSALGIDFRSDNIKKWMVEHTGYSNQDVEIENVEKTRKMIIAYKTLIKGKEQANETK